MKMMTFPTHTSGAKFGRAVQVELVNHGAKGAHPLRSHAAGLLEAAGESFAGVWTQVADAMPMLMTSAVVTGLVAMAVGIGLGFRGGL